MSDEPKVLNYVFKVHPDKVEDAIVPVQIEHECDEIVPGTEHAATYNFLSYHFEYAGRYVEARVYLQEIDTAALFGPFNGRDTGETIDEPIHPGVIAYLRRRYRTLLVFGPDGYHELEEKD